MDAPINNDAVLDAVRQLFDSGTWWIYKGKTVKQFEARFASSHGGRYGVSTCNGTVPLEIVLRALGIGRGDRVILPAYDFYSLPKSVSNTGATPLFADVGTHNPTISGAVAERELVCIHHTDVLKGTEYWQGALEKLRNDLATGGTQATASTHA